MARLLVHLEGQTEEDFVNEVLRDYLLDKGFASISARIVGNSRLRSRRGGIRPWPSVRKDIVNHLKEDPACLATTMVDYYALPATGSGAWPARSRPASSPVGADKAQAVERGMLDDLTSAMGRNFDPRRFIPFVVMHEFEGLLFSDCSGFGRGIGRPDLEPAFQSIRDLFPSPEEINDSPDSAPSKRVQALMPRYDKPLHGALAALEIGVDRVRRECPHFRQWLDRLESAI